MLLANQRYWHNNIQLNRYKKSTFYVSEIYLEWQQTNIIAKQFHTDKHIEIKYNLFIVWFSFVLKIHQACVMLHSPNE